MNKRCALILFTILALCASGFAQKSATVYKVPSITVDGNLDETYWGTDRIAMKHDVGMMLTDGSIESYDDASTEFILLWDDEALYCGSFNKDDIHNAPWTAQPGMTNQAWKDDGHEYWVSFDFNDVWEDASPLYYGQFGWQVWFGWVFENGAVNPQYVAYRNDNGPTNTTVDDMKEQGFYAPYSSADGINFNAEAQFKWSSSFLGAMSTPTAGKELGFNLGLTDNDGGDMAAAWLRWAEGNHNTYQGWGKATISDDPPPNIGIRPVRIIHGAKPAAFAAASYDILGRKIPAGLRTRVAGATFNRMKDGSATRSILLR